MCLLLQISNSINTEVKYITKLRISIQKNERRDNTGEVKEKFSEWKMENSKLLKMCCLTEDMKRHTASMKTRGHAGMRKHE